MDSIPNAQYSILTKDPDWYEGFPDICFTNRQDFYCIYRRSLGHVGKNHSLYSCRSEDGIVWGPSILFQPPHDEDEGELWNSPKIQKIGERLEVICDYHDLFRVQDVPSINMWKSNNDGLSWAGPIPLPLIGVSPDKFLINPEDHEERILALHYRDEKSQRLKHVIYRSEDDGDNWWAEELLAADGEHDYLEASLLNYCSETQPCAIIAFIRDDHLIGRTGNIHSPLHVGYSSNFGRSWSIPFELPILGHRPIARMLSDGRLLVSYRDLESHGMAIWVSRIDDHALDNFPDCTFEDLFKDQHFYMVEQEDPSTPITDFGYSGWTENPDSNDIVLVYQTRNNGKNCYIKSVKFSIKDI